MPKFFITHSWQDIDFAKRLCDDLRAHGLDGFFDAYSIQAGDDILVRIERGLEECDFYVPVLSSAALESAWCKIEINAAISLSAERDRGGRPRIIPVVAKKCRIPTLLRPLFHIDFTASYEDGLNELLAKGFGLPPRTDSTTHSFHAQPIEKALKSVTKDSPRIKIPHDRSEQVTMSRAPSNLDTEHDIRRLATISDRDLIEASLGNNDVAWRVLVERYSRLVYSIPLRWGLATEDADIVFENVFTMMFRQLEHLCKQANLPAWLIALTHRETMRLRKRPVRNDENRPSALMDTMLRNDVETWEHHAYVQQAFSQLDPEWQKLLTALFLDPSSPSFNEIALRLGLPEGIVQRLRDSDLKKLRAILKEIRESM